MFYFLLIFGLFLYSFTQVDLSLTVSRSLFLNNIIDSFQHIGFFMRPLSTYIFSAIVLALFGFWFYFLNLARENKIDKRNIWKIIIITSSILIFSYNAFSYDLFNYIFDAKIFTHYGLNPYLHKALDFPGDPMLSFMRWTHRVYPYGPVWLALTVPLSYLGLNFFIPTFFLFKLFIGAFFVGSIYFIGKILQKIAPKKEVLGLVFFGLSPLVLIESLVSAHIDIVMVFFVLWATYSLVNKKYILLILLFLISIGIKFATVFISPVFFWIWIRRGKTSLESMFSFAVILLILSALVSSYYSGNFQPWYLLLPLSFAAFVSYKYYIFIPSVFVSIFAIFNYVPYLYLGNWDPPVPEFLFWIQIGSVIVSILAVAAYFLYQKSKVKNQKYNSKGKS